MRLIFMNFGQMRIRFTQMGVALAVTALVAGCGSTYRPVVTPSNPSGPASQPASYVMAVSATSAGVGYATVIDYSGDTEMAQAMIGADTGPAPMALSVDEAGTTAYTINSDGTVTSFPVSTTLQAKNVVYSTLPTTAQLAGLFTPSSGMWAADMCYAKSSSTSLCKNGADVFSGSPESLELSVSVAPTPVTIVGSATVGTYNYVISQNNSSTSTLSYGVDCNISPSTVTQTGEADSILISTDTIASTIPLGVCPVFAVPSSDGKRLFVLNRGSDTITVIDTTTNALDTCTGRVSTSGRSVTCHPTLPLSTTAITNTGITPTGCNTSTDSTCGGMTTTAGPVYAEYNAATSQLVVANYDGSTVSIIDATLDEYGNDSDTFGTTYTVAVGKNPASVTALYGGSRAYTANQTDGTVSIVNLASHALESQTALTVRGHPRTVVSTQNSEYAKVYVASPDSTYLTIIDASTNTVDTWLLLNAGNIVDVRVSSQDASTSDGNSNVNSRMPGAGQPCNLPPGLMASNYTLADCQKLPQ